MSGFRKLVALSLLIHLWLPAAAASHDANQGQGQDDPLRLADLARYRAALSGKATADDARPSDPPARVRFRDLWERPGAFQGRRVTVRGRVERIFRQGPVGSFPPLVEVWAVSPAGDPFCLVFPLPGTVIGGSQESGTAFQTVGDRGPDARVTPQAVPEPGRTIRFTGTFLKKVRYAAGDGARLAPLIVGDRPPAPAPAEAGNGESPSSRAGEVLRAIGGNGPNGGSGFDRWAWSLAGWMLGLVLTIFAAGVLARRHLRGVPQRGPSATRNRRLDETMADPPLLFIDTTDESPV